MTFYNVPNRLPSRPSPAPLYLQVLARPTPRMTRKTADNLDQALGMLSEAERTIREQEERIRQLENMAMTDELTGLLNRRGLMGALRRELAQASRVRKPSGLLVLIDLDGFKQINDIYGHGVGDAYLQTVASVLINEVRTSDFVARIGGDEFAVLIPTISPKDAAKRFERLDATLNSRVMHNRELSIPLRGSLGFAVIADGETPESLLVAADMKLYANKAQRRQRL